MANITVSVTDANNITVQLTPVAAQNVTIDRGVAGNGISSIVPVTISTLQYLRIYYTNGTQQDVGPLTSTAYAGVSPIDITGNTISLLTVPINKGGTNATTAAAAIENLLPSYTGNGSKRLGLNSGATALEWVLDGGGTVTSVAVSGGTTGLTTSGGPITGSGTITLAGTLAVANGGTGVTTSTGTGSVVLSTSPSLVTPLLGTPTSGNFSTGTFTWPTFNQNTTGTAAGLSATLVATSGGTGQSIYAIGDLLYASSTTALSKLADVATGNALISGGVSTAPSWGKIGLTTHVSGTLPTTNGGTGLTSFTANGVVYASSTSALTTGSALTFSGTSLGLGSTASITGGTTITVNGGSSASEINMIRTTGADLNLIAGASFAQLGTQTNYPVSFIQNGSEGMRLTSTGLTTQKDATIYGVTVGRGSGAVSTNTAVGASALAANTTGDRNTAFGNNALYSNAGGANNVALGDRSAYLNSSGANNTVVGGAALYSNISGSNNVAIGRSALESSTTASNNTAVGYQAGYSNTTATATTAIGYRAAYSNNTTNGVTAVGHQAAQSLSNGNTNNYGEVYIGDSAGLNASTATDVVSVGSNSLRSSTTGSKNVAVGAAALYSNTTASNNTAVGYQAGYTNATGTFVTAVGYKTLYLSTGDWNTAFGGQALGLTTTGQKNVAMGLNAAYNNTTGSFNTAIGIQALNENTTASGGTAVGYQAGYTNVTGTQLTAVGYQALYNSSANLNTALGYRAGYAITSSYGNVAIGYSSMSNSAGITGIYNIAIGGATLTNQTSGNRNIAIGNEALSSNTTGECNIVVGAYQSGGGDGALALNTTGSYNVAIGSAALAKNTTASSNTAVGYQAGYTNSTGTRITMIGNGAGQNSTGNDNTFVGQNAGNAITTGVSNTLLGRYNGNQGGLDIRTASNYIVLSDGDGNPRGIFDSSGNLLVGKTSAGNSINGAQLSSTYQIFTNTSDYISIFNRRGTDGVSVYFQKAETNVGTISVTTVATTFNSLSDYRLKNITGSLTGAKDFIMALQPKQGTWKADGSKFVGFLAHEFQEVSPSSVTGEKDAVDADGKPIMQSMQASSAEVMANLVAFVQELKAEIDSLKSQLNGA